MTGGGVDAGLDPTTGLKVGVPEQRLVTLDELLKWGRSMYDQGFNAGVKWWGSSGYPPRPEPDLSGVPQNRGPRITGADIPGDHINQGYQHTGGMTAGGGQQGGSR